MNKANENVLLKNVRLWNGKTFETREEVRIYGGSFVEKNDKGEDCLKTEVDCSGALAIPALFALGLDFMEPLRDDVYTMKDGFCAMRRGGFYGGLYESAANPIDDFEKLAASSRRVKNSGLDIRFLGAFSVGSSSLRLAEMLELSFGDSDEHVFGFGDCGHGFSTIRFLRLAMEYGKMTGKRFFFLPMEQTLRKNGCAHEGEVSDALGMKGIPRIAETIAAHAILEMAHFLKTPVHLKQVTCGETLDLVREARKKNIDVTCDVGIYHLLFDDSKLFTLSSAYHFDPPLRSSSDKDALWEGLADGTIDAISVNHTPVLRQNTEINFEDSLPGSLSLEIALEALWKPLIEKVGEARAIELLSIAPARIALSAPSGETFQSKNKSVNLVVFSPDKPRRVLASDFSGHVCNSPLINQTVPSSIIGSYIGGIWTER